MNKDKGKVLIKYMGDMKFSVNIKGNVPLNAILVQMLLENIIESGTMNREEFIEALSSSYDLFKEEMEMNK